MEAHKSGIEGDYDFAKQTVQIESDRSYVLRECIQACRKGGTVSLAGVYRGFVDTLPMGAAFNKGLTLKMGQTHVHRYLRPLFEKIESGQIDPSFVVTHTLSLEEAPNAYQLFKKKQDGCIKLCSNPKGVVSVSSKESRNAPRFFYFFGKLGQATTREVCPFYSTRRTAGSSAR